jgi:alpha 1,2-mannosyltransferase
VHSIAVALFAGKDQLHWFDDIGYRHEPFQHCPSGDAHERGRCSCDPGETADWEWYSCASKYIAMFPDAGKNKD